MIYLRKLNIKDIPYIYEWMTDADIYRYFRFDGTKVTSESIEAFVAEAQKDNNNIHRAVADETDRYLGTVSLKNIDYDNSNAEYAIAFRKEAMGQGISKIATDLIINMAFNELKLHRVYLNVLKENSRAIRFYEKYGFQYEGEFKDALCLRGEFKDLCWYSIINTRE